MTIDLGRNDLTNIQWANRLGRLVRVRDRQGVHIGILDAVGVGYIIINRKKVWRAEIIEISRRTRGTSA